ncbi:MAG: transcription termination factor NusA [Candidatus Spechtbacterales bacterium]
MDLKAFTSAVAQISEEKGIPEEVVLETIETAIAAAYKKDYGKKGQIIRAKLDKETGALKLWQVKLVVDESMIKSEEEIASQSEKESRFFVKEDEEQLLEEGEKKVRFNPEKHIMTDEAKAVKKGAKPGDELIFDLETKEDFGRIAAQTAKQVILQRIREAEREAIFKEFKSKEDQLVSAIVQRVEGGAVFLDIGKTIGVMLLKDQMPMEQYRIGARLRVYVVEVEVGPKGPQIYVSRAHPKMLSRLFELEVPEVSTGAVVIKSIAREPGARSKIAVTATQQGIDPIGSMVGQRGTRVSAVINELAGEKVDIIEWDEDREKFVANALSPAKVLAVQEEKNRMVVIVSEDQLSLAIGKGGQNVRLAAKLTGWKIDIKSRETGPPSLGEARKTEETAEAEKVEEKQETKTKTKKIKKVKK